MEAQRGYTGGMIGELRTVVLDTRTPRALAKFYAELLGGQITGDEEDWVVLTDERGGRLGFQLAPEYEPPRFPDPKGSQQFHLDVRIARDTLEEATRQVVALGGRKLDESGDDFQVFTDPSGHPFCLVWLD